ncbi:hypothetical protein TNCV_3219101 [Trichonephila clavipes]|nr:hypothetical protein TNCV_3219101 [Trichonephila clavipes]
MPQQSEARGISASVPDLDLSFESFQQHSAHSCTTHSCAAKGKPAWTLEKKPLDRVMEVTPPGKRLLFRFLVDKKFIESHVLEEIKLNLRIDEISQQKS